MLRFISCSGFKSLKGFELELSKGLNILVGPNGSGKTNIILFLEFLGNIRRGSLMEAVSSVGGAGRIFRRSRNGRPETEIYFSIKGSGFFQDFTDIEYFVEYEYNATISLILAINEIVYSAQRMTLKLRTSDQRAGKSWSPFSEAKCDISTEINEAGELVTRLPALDTKMTRFSPHIANLQEVFAKQVEEGLIFARSVSLIDLLQRSIIGPSLISQDLLGAKALNIEPNKVREAEDVATPPIIRSDGVGFAATMFALQPSVGPYGKFPQRLPRRNFSSPDLLLQEILNNSSLVNQSIRGIYVQQDTLESKLRVSIDIAYEGDSTLRLPISLVSDGTAKWLALVAAVITNRSVFAIEEPENFLHPAMQREIVSLVRSQYDEHLSAKDNRFAIMTTHSETILDNARPEELIVVDMEFGETRARRPRNIDQLVAQISKTGFGLGHFYRSGAVE